MSYFLELVNSTNILINSRTFLKLLKSRKHQVAQWLGNETVLLSTQNMFWVRNKENNFPIRTLIWRPGPLDGDVNWMSPLQGRSPLVQVKEPYGNLDIGFHPATWSAQSTLADNTRKRGSSSI